MRLLRKTGYHSNRGALFLTTVVSLLTLVTAEWSLQPDSLTDDCGNEADNASSIRWAVTPPGEPYVTSTKYDTGFLTPTVIFAHCFINLVQPNVFPIGIVLGIFDGTFVLSRDYKQLIEYGIGIIICVCIGLLFSVLMPIIGCCFCCCRLQGKCGGKRVQRMRPNDCAKKIGFIACLSTISIIIGFGGVVMLVANERMTDAINNYNTSLRDNFGDLRRYLNNIGKEINHTGLTNFNFTKEVIFRDLDNIGFLVGVPVRDKLLSAVKLDEAIAHLFQFGDVIQSMGNRLLDINASISHLKEDAGLLLQQLNETKVTIEEAQQLPGCGDLCLRIDTSQLNMEVDFQELPDISSQVNAMADLMSTNFNGMVLQGRATIDNIPKMAVNQTTSLVQDVKGSLDDFRTTIEQNIREIQDLPRTVRRLLIHFSIIHHAFQFDEGVKDIETKALDAIATAISFNKARWLACLGMALVVLLIVFLQLFGICFGICGYKPSAKPIERSALSNSGGNCLMAAVGFVKIFAWLLMLINTVLFAVGSNLEKLVCEAVVHDPNYVVVKKLLDGPGGIMCQGCNTYMLGELLLGNGSIPLTFSETLVRCKNNEAAYPTLKLRYLLDLNSVVDYKKKIDIDAKMEEVKVDLSGIEILSSDTKEEMNKVVSSTAIDYKQFNDTLSKNLTSPGLDEFASGLDLVLNSSDTVDPAKAKLQSAADQLSDIRSGQYAKVYEEMHQLSQKVTGFEADSSNLPKQVNDTINITEIAQQIIQILGPTVVKEEARLFSIRLQNVADRFVNHTLYEIENNVGRCLPIWNMWESLADIAVCKYTVDTLNCFWFAIGCAVFFMVPSVILDVMLAKHFRRMDCMEEFDTKPIQATKKAVLAKAGKIPIFVSPKVAPIG